MKPEPINTRSAMRKLACQLRGRLQFTRAEPQLAAKVAAAFVAARMRRSRGPKILVGTHHKVLTMYMIRVFEAFAHITNRSISIGMADNLDYDADIVFDHHSQFDFSRLNCEYAGIHFRRDPRDLVISAGFYHKRSDEAQLHVPHDEFGGKTYQEHVNAMDSMEDVFLFELDHSAGMNITQMFEWDYSLGFLELKYEDLVTPEGSQVFRKAIEQWSLPTIEQSLLSSLFDYHSVYGSAGKKSHHVRNPKSRQFEHHFSEKLYREFNDRFPNAVVKLGYN